MTGLHRALLAAHLTAGIAALTACAGSATPRAHTTAHTAETASTAERALPVLQRLAESQQASPHAPARSLAPLTALTDAPPSALPAADLAPSTPASTPLADALTHFQSQLAPPPTQPTTPSEPPDADSLVQSMKLYAAARLALLNGDVAQGLRDLEAALRLNPESPELLESLADAQLRTGRRASGVATLRRAFDAGSRDPRSLWLIARDNLRTSRRDEALPLLANAWSDALLRTDPPLALVIGADLAEALAHAGYASASADLFSTILALTPESLPRTPSTPDAAEVFRRKGDLRTLEGDQWMRLGNTDRAVTAYRASAQSGSIDPGAALARTVQALAQSGRPAQAALELLKDIESRQGALDERHALLARYLSQPEAGIADLLARAITEQTGTLTGSTPSTRLAMTRLAAACQSSQPDAAARARASRTLINAVPQNGADAGLLGDLLDLSGSPRAAREALAAVLEYDPLYADACAEALIEHGRDTDDNLRALQGSRAFTDRLLAACMLRRAGQPQAALDHLGTAPAEAAETRAWTAAQALILADLGRTDDAANAALTLVNESDGASALPRAVRSQEDLREPEAIALVVRALAGPPDAVAVGSRRAAGMIAAATQRGTLAEELLQEAQQLDPRSESTYELLLAIYSPSGAASDSTKLTDTLRSLRQAQPGSSLVRRLVAMDLVQKGLSRQAQPQLLSLIDTRGQPPAALASLVDAWERAARTDPTLADEGEQWLRARLAHRPQSPTLLLALSRVLVANGKAQEAESLLAERTRTWPTDALLRQREFVLREGLGKAAEADALALQRLAAAPPTLDTLLERANAAIAQRNISSAAADIERALSLIGTPPRPDAVTRLAQFLNAIPPSAVEGALAADVDSLLKSFAAVEPLLPQEPANTLTLTHIKLLAAGVPDATDRIADAITRLAERRASLGELAESEARKALFGERAGQKDPSNALRLVGVLALRAPEAERARFIEWMISTVFLGNTEDLRWMLGRIDTLEIAQRFLTAIEEQEIEVPTPPDTLEEHKGEVAHIFAGLATQYYRDQLAADAHRTALEFIPKHPWVSNDYGYAILERGGDIAEAARLIEQAYEQVPERSSITDSLGWLRYKQGRIEDDPARAGEVGGGMGAVSLLTRATQLDEGGTNPEVLEHLGDALWRWNKQASRRDAERTWSRALTMQQLELRQRQTLGRGAKDPRVQENQAVIARLQQKLADAAAGKEPAIAEIGIPATFTPRPIPPLAEEQPADALNPAIP